MGAPVVQTLALTRAGPRPQLVLVHTVAHVSAPPDVLEERATVLWSMAAKMGA